MTSEEIAKVRAWLLTLENHNYNQPECWLEMALDEVGRLQYRYDKYRDMATQQVNGLREMINLQASSSIVANTEIDKLRAENEKLRTFINPKLFDDNLAGKWVLDTGEIDKLRAVAEAAEKYMDEGAPNSIGPTGAALLDALETWRGEPGTDANGSPVY